MAGTDYRQSDCKKYGKDWFFEIAEFKQKSVTNITEKEDDNEWKSEKEKGGTIDVTGEKKERRKQTLNPE